MNKELKDYKDKLHSNCDEGCFYHCTEGGTKEPDCISPADGKPKLGAVPYEYGAMSSKFRLYATDKLTAYATMVLHFNQSNYLVVIYEPESSKEDMWTSLTGKVSERLDEIFGGEGSFDKYLEENISEIKECYKSIERLV